ncbi:bifunctional diguanylate cyclase/phosphodiesterase [Kineococcus glutinatus]|uniref:Diguanylate cyclase (GGDEF)-like protein n=1 Tax=Kineococcus glutinatus TaxID=1070872 RepID=A0ABP8VFZ0_9ACTN
MRLPRRVPAAVAAAIAVAGYAAALLGLRGGSAPLLLDATVGNAVTLGATGLLWWRVRSGVADRAVLVPLAAGLSATALNEAAADLVEVVGAGPPRGPAVVVAPVLAMPCFLLAAQRYVRTRLADRHPGSWLDAVAGTLAIAGWLLLLEAPLRRVLGGVLAGGAGVPLALPAVDVVVMLQLLAVVVWCGARSDVRLWFVIAALALAGAGHLGWVVQEQAGTYGGGNPVDALFTAATVLAAAVGWVPPPRTPLLRASVTRLLVPPSAVLVLCGALLATGAAPRRAEALVGAALLLVVGRLALAHRELVPLSHARHLSLTDELTGLGNRRALLAALAEAEQREEPCALLLLDLQRFKEVNDALGHAAGDELLRSVAARLRARARRGDLPARLGGDEFALLLPGTALAQAQHLADALAADLARAHRLSGTSLHVPAGVGVAARPVHTTSAAGLLHCADVAMYGAKRERRPVLAYDERLDRRSGDRLRLVEELRAVLAPGADGGSLVLHFQPKIDLATGGVAGAEALVRWQHPRLGLLDPTSFLATAEQRGLMPTLTRQVLSGALAEAARWHREGHQVPVAVNLSATDVLDAGLPDRVRAALRRHGLPASALHLEITETVVLGDSTRAREVVAQLAGLGVRLSVDDYGTGYSSLAYLRDLAVHDLKLDRSFVADVAADARAAAVVRTTVDLAHSLGLRLVAEGVADEEGLRLLRAMGCDESQSHLHSPPLPAAEFRAWLGAHEAVPAS